MSIGQSDFIFQMGHGFVGGNANIRILGFASDFARQNSEPRSFPNAQVGSRIPLRLANALDTSVAANYDMRMDNQTVRPTSAGDREAKPRPRVETKSMAQAWADYCALDHAPKQEFNPSRTAPMPQDRDRGDRGR